MIFHILQVTLVGESAGAHSVAIQYTTAKSYFQGAILQSAPYTIAFK